ncbi:MAG TPA: response regulator transcription factor [Anaerohalosphaeraceae bacterium]|jgi:DNA-binding NarL/FixJ family response regulator|nr:response regulator transcription factor [Anaerohalosphaeraceae bacterium]HPB92220.1 response regulator transcription factor [Anaerohalosphaeraceae bacterium]HRT24293.1 response regulator transcription factor [Anaerohalosphaeraceae bacterium]HRU15935.1 response regulator transcription factor [Anaerohalosphaeraceae bacterium]
MRIVLVDDHEIVREGMCALLQRRPDVEVVGQAGDGRTAVALVQKLQPDIVIMDIGMPNLNGIDATQQMLAENPHLKILALSTHSDAWMVAKMIRAGAKGYMLKESAFSELANALDVIMEGKTYLCSKIASVVFTDYVNMLTNPNWVSGELLTTREREVLQLVAEGRTTRQIAQILGLSPKTVDSHRDHIMKKLNIRTVAGLTKYAIQEGLTSHSP